MDQKTAVNVGFGAARLAFGMFALATPKRLGSSWIGSEDAHREPTAVILRALGVRDVVLGAGTMAGSLQGTATPWLAASTAADLGDMTTTVLAKNHLPARGVKATVALTAAAGAAGAVLIALNEKG